MARSAEQSARERGSSHVVLLWVFSTLFAFRVAAQLVQHASPIGVLPPFEAWQGSSLRYPVLLTTQLVILAALVLGATAVTRRARANRQIGAWLLALGSVYFVSMSARLVLGLTLLAQVSWFAKSLPALFHMVLAGYILTLGHYHWAREFTSAVGVSPEPALPRPERSTPPR